MSLVLLLALAAAPTPARQVVATDNSTARECTATLRPAKGAPKAGIHTLAQEPNAAAIRPVMRRVDGCLKPVLIREDIGSQPKRRGGS